MENGMGGREQGVIWFLAHKNGRGDVICVVVTTSWYLVYTMLSSMGIFVAVVGVFVVFFY